MKITGIEWKQIFDLLDEYLEKSEADRSSLLLRLASKSPQLKATFERLLEQYPDSDTDHSPSAPLIISSTEIEVARGRLTKSTSPAAGSEVGPYRLVREVGEGGMSTVWLASRSDGKMRREVALKLPHLALHGASFIERFGRERDILSALTHPNIARLYDAGISPEGQPYLAMEYVEGTPIIAYCNAHRLSVHERSALFLQVLQAVEFAHAHLVIHRDIKPSNILVNAQGQISLLDFGIAKLIVDGEVRETEITRIGGRALTPEYASPEQILGQVLTTASDVYSLGVVFYELLSGARPYQLKRNSRAALEEAIVAEAIPRPSHVVEPAQAAAHAMSSSKWVKALRGDLDTIVLKSLKKQATERYPTVNAFADDIMRHLRGDPVLAQADSAWYRARKFIGRNKLAVASVAAVGLALSVGLGVALWQAKIAHEQRVIADSEAFHARSEAAKASTESKKADAIKDFLLSIFNANDPKKPMVTKPSELTAREILDEGERRIAASLDDQPDTKLEILLALGGLYDEMGLPEKASAVCRQAESIAEQLLVDRAEASAGALKCIALAKEQSDRNAAEKAIVEAERLLDSIGDHTSILYAQVETIHASLLRQYGLQRKNELVAILTRVIPLWERRYPDDEGHMVAWAYLANVYWDLGQRAQAVQAADHAIEAARGGSGGQLGLADAYFTRAQYENKLGDYRPAEADYSAASAIYTDILGVNHFKTLRNKCLLGRVLHAQGKREAGIALLVQSTASLEKALPSSDALSICLEQLGYAYIEQGRADKAEPIFAKAAAIFERLGDKLFLTNAQLGIAMGLEFQGRYGEARRLAQNVIAVRRGNQSQTASLRTAVLRLAQIELDADHPTEAGSLLEGVISSDRSTDALEPLPLDVTTAKLLKAEVERRVGDNAGALALTANILASLGSQKMPFSEWVEAASLGTRGAALCDSGQFAQGLESLSRSLELIEKRHQPASPFIADAHAAVGKCLFRMGMRDDARLHLLRAQAVLGMHRAIGEHFRRPVRALEQLFPIGSVEIGR